MLAQFAELMLQMGDPESNPLLAPLLEQFKTPEERAKFLELLQAASKPEGTEAIDELFKIISEGIKSTAGTEKPLLALLQQGFESLREQLKSQPPPA